MAVAVIFDVSEEFTSFCVNKSLEATLNFVSVIFSIVVLKEVKKLLILLRVSCESKTVSFSSSSVSTLARLSAVRDSTQELVSNPDVRPLNDILTANPFAKYRGNKICDF